MSHIYIHIPFCHSKCYYCDFYSVATNEAQQEFVKAIIEEIKLRKDEILGPFKTIYFGGGTPTILSDESLERIFENLYKYYSISSDAEITIEANPEDISAKKSSFFKQIGVNRISLGVQSLSDKELKYLGRKHDAKQAICALETLSKAKFDNISVDFIHGIPNSDLSNFSKSIELVKNIGVKHLSMYSLTVEKGTILCKRIEKGITANIDENQQAEEYILAIEIAEKNGFKQYEISNFSVPEFESKHNSAYWKGSPYLGFGPSAHSFNGEIRKWNIANIQKYIAGIAEQKPIFESETLSEIDKHNEFLLTRLRMNKGIQISEMKNLFGINAVNDLKNFLHANSLSKNFNISDESISLTRGGMLFADKLISDLMK